MSVQKGYMNICSSINHNSQKRETTQMSEWRMDKQYVVYPYNEMLDNKRVYWHTLHMINLENILLACKRSQPEKTKYYMIPSA